MPNFMCIQWKSIKLQNKEKKIRTTQLKYWKPTVYRLTQYLSLL